MPVADSKKDSDSVRETSRDVDQDKDRDGEKNLKGAKGPTKSTTSNLH